MSAVAATMPPVVDRGVLVPAVEDRRGVFGMKLTIATEGSLFVVLFFSYFFLNNGSWYWPNQEPPKLALAFCMLAILLVSSLVIAWGEKQLKRGFELRARAAIGATIFLGLIFMAVQTLEYHQHLKTLTPRTNVYGSIFYTIVTFHAAHVIAGLVILSFVVFLPQLGAGTRSPHQPLHAAALYWHFVDAVWIAVVLILYVLPHLR